MKRARNLVLLLCALLALAPIASTEAAHKPKAAGSSLKMTALSVNEDPFAPGTKVTESAPVNACYYVFREAALLRPRSFLGRASPSTVKSPFGGDEK